jgi:hypothetical protein
VQTVVTSEKELASESQIQDTIPDEEKKIVGQI